ncbi:hypothetical protein EJD97_011844, partial [Solanum chilense]
RQQQPQRRRLSSRLSFLLSSSPANSEKPTPPAAAATPASSWDQQQLGTAARRGEQPLSQVSPLLSSSFSPLVHFPLLLCLFLSFAGTNNSSPRGSTTSSLTPSSLVPGI